MRAVLQSRINGIYDFSTIFMNMLPCLSLSIFLILHNWSSQPSFSHSGDCSLNLLIRGRKRWVKERAKIEAVIVGRIFPTVLASFSIRIETMFSMLVHCILPYYWYLCRKSHLQASMCTDGVSVVTKIISTHFPSNLGQKYLLLWRLIE